MDYVVIALKAIWSLSLSVFLRMGTTVIKVFSRKRLHAAAEVFHDDS